MKPKIEADAPERHEAGRDIGRELMEAVDEIRTGGGRRFALEPKTAAAKAGVKTGLTQVQFAGLLSVSRRTSEQWEQGRRQPSGAARRLIRIAELRPEVLREIEG